MRTTFCTVPGCTTKAITKGLCKKHYMRVWRSGTTDGIRPNVPLPERFWPKVNKNAANGCWLWTASLGTHGYGQVAFNGTPRPAHRVAYELAIGPIPKGRDLDHLCRNRACVNPAHLEPVDRRTNLLRGDTETARNAAKTHCLRGHPYDEANTYHRQNGGRVCRACARLARRR